MRYVARIKADLEVILDTDEEGALKATEVWFDTRSAESGQTLLVVAVDEESGEEFPASDEVHEEALSAVPGKGVFIP